MSRPYRGESECEWLGITCPEDCATLSADDYDNEELDDLRYGRIREADAQSGQEEKR